MERRSFIQKTGLAGVLAAGAAPAIVNAQASIRWRIASSFPKSLDTLFGASDVFAKKVSDMTGGKFVISTARRRRADARVRRARRRVQRHGRDGPYRALLFLRQGPDVRPRLRDSVRPELAPDDGVDVRRQRPEADARVLREGYNIVNFPGGNTGAQMGGWYRKEIKSVADIKGLKFRVGGFAGKVIERMGGVPQNIPGGEIYQALEKGTIDAAEWVGPYDDLKLGFNKVAPNYYYPGWWEGGPQLDIFVNQKAYDGLTPENKAIVEAGRCVLPTSTCRPSTTRRTRRR